MIKSIDEIYKEIVEDVFNFGEEKDTRTGIKTLSTTGAMIKYDMENGFPILTTKKIAWKTLCVELEGFIKGITDKKWFQERKSYIWNEWCSPEKVPYGHSDLIKEKMRNEQYLGPIYGAQWRNFNNSGIDQLKNAIETLKKDPNSRRIIVNAWNPQQLDEMALPPCHYSFQLLCNKKGQLDLLWNQRSVDVFLGLPFNIASYALLLELIAKECGLRPRFLVGFLADVHIYVNHADKLKTQLERTPFKSPKLFIESKGLWDWDHTKQWLCGYNHHSAIKGEVAV